MVILTKRQNNVLLYLMNQRDFLTIESLANKYDVSPRTIRNDFLVIDDFLNCFNVKMIRKPSIGIKLIGDELDFNELRKSLLMLETRALDQSERNEIIALALLVNDMVTFDMLADICSVSRQTIISSFIDIERLFKQNEIDVVKTQGKGICLCSDEYNIRKMFEQLLNSNLRNETICNVIVNNCNIKKFDCYGLSLLEKVEKDLSINFVEPRRVQIYLAYIFYRIFKGHEISDDKSYEDLEITKNHKCFDQVKNLIDSNCTKNDSLFIISYLLNSKLISNQNEISENDELSIEAKKLANYLIDQLQTIHVLDQNSKEYFVNGLTLHLKVAIYRIRNNVNIENELLDQIKINIPLIYEFTKNELNKCEKEYNLVFSENEIAYVSMYLASAYENSLKVEMTLNILIVCAFGVATSTILKTRIHQAIPECNIIGPMSKNEADLYLKSNDVELIVSTNDYYYENTPCVTVNPLLGSDDIEFIKGRLFQLSYSRMCNHFITAYAAIGKQSNKVYIRDLVSIDDIQVIDFIDGWEKAIEVAANPLVKKGFIETRYVQKMIDAVNQFGTYMVLVPETAFIHAGTEDGIKCNCTSILVLKKPLVFGSKNPKIIRNLVILGVKNKEENALINLVYIFEKDINLLMLKTPNITPSIIHNLHD